MPILARLAATSLAFCAACTVGATDPGPGPDPDPDPTTGGIAGTITTDQAWSGNVHLTADAAIAAGVTVTILPGTTFDAKQGTTLRVAGTLTASGTKDQPVTILPATGAPNWSGIVADAGGTVSLTHVMGTDVATLVYCKEGATCALDHVEFSSMGTAIVAEGKATITASRLTQVANGGVSIRGNGDLTMTDSYVLTSQGDIIVQSGGSLTISYSEVGDAQGSYEHCDLHISAAAKLSITRSNIRNGVFGMMIGGTNGATIQYNNFIANGKAPTGADIDPVGENVAADFQHNYWDQGAPIGMGAGYDFTNAEPAMVTDAGPRAANL